LVFDDAFRRVRMFEKKKSLGLILIICAVVSIAPAMAAWWDSSYDYRRNITNETTSDLGMSVNGTGGFNGSIIWMNPSQGDMELYYNDSGTSSTYAVANDTAELNYETEGGGLNNSIGSIWSSNAVGIWHMDGTDDSTSNNNDGSLVGNPNQVSGMFGSSYNFSDAISLM